jgi:hypothetical protein
MKTIKWLFEKRLVEQSLLNYCKLEYRASDVPSAYARLLAQHKENFFK